MTFDTWKMPVYFDTVLYYIINHVPRFMDLSGSNQFVQFYLVADKPLECLVYSRSYHCLAGPSQGRSISHGTQSATQSNCLIRVNIYLGL